MFRSFEGAIAEAPDDWCSRLDGIGDLVVIHVLLEGGQSCGEQPCGILWALPLLLPTSIVGGYVGPHQGAAASAGSIQIARL